MKYLINKNCIVSFYDENNSINQQFTKSCVIDFNDYMILLSAERFGWEDELLVWFNFKEIKKIFEEKKIE